MLSGEMEIRTTGPYGEDEITCNQCDEIIPYSTNYFCDDEYNDPTCCNFCLECAEKLILIGIRNLSLTLNKVKENLKEKKEKK